MTRYESFVPFKPLRPGDKPIPPVLIAGVEAEGGKIAQVKYDGTNSLAYCFPRETGAERKVEWRTRDTTPHDQWNPTADSNALFVDWPGNGWAVVNAELLNNKVKVSDGGFKDVLVIFDFYVQGGVWLTDFSYGDRYTLLHEILKDSIVGETWDHYIINDHVWLAKNFKRDFTGLFRGLKDRIHEGIVIKDWNAPYHQLGQQVKCRRPKTALDF